MEYVKLNNGVEIPKLGYGVFQISQSECEECVLEALKIGYRLIDTAQSYANEEQVGDALNKCGIAREKLIITTKVWIDNYGYEKTISSLEKSLKKLKVDYLDLVLLHQPFGDYYGSYRALEKLYEERIIRAIGVSNFYPDRLSDLCAFNKIIPQINQVETNPFNQQIEAQKNMEKNQVQIEAWAPLGEGRSNMFTNPTLTMIATKYQKTVAQVILRWLLQRNVVALAKTVRVEKMKENFDIFNFTLANEDLRTLSTLDRKESLFFNHQDVATVDYFKNLIKERGKS